MHETQGEPGITPGEPGASATDPGAGRQPVLRRALDVLDCFNGAAEVTVAGVCKATGLPPATVHRILASLTEWGAVERSSYGRYRLGTRLWKLVAGTPRWLRMRELAQPHLVDLHLATRATTYLVVPDGIDGVHTDRITRVRVTRPGIIPAIRRVPLHRTGAGRVLLAYSSSTRSALLRRAENDPVLADGVPILQEQLKQIRSSGYAVSHQDGAADRITVAAPVFDNQYRILASVVAAFPDTRISDPAPVVPRVVESARRLTADLAHYDSGLLGTE